MLSIFPRSAKFGPLLAELGDNAHATAQALVWLFEHPEAQDAGIARLRDGERQGDALARRVIDTVRDSFLVPFDREDILNLNEQLDDFVDNLEDAGRRLRLYRLPGATDAALQLARIAVQQAELLRQVLPRLGEPRRARDAGPLLDQVRALESQADEISEGAQARLFDGAADIPTLVHALRWSELYALLEEVTDGAQRVANRIEEVLLKNA